MESALIKLTYFNLKVWKALKTQVLGTNTIGTIGKRGKYYVLNTKKRT